MSNKGVGQKKNCPPEIPEDAADETSCVICESPDNSRMVACDACMKWFHFKCVGVDESIQNRDWSCEKCVLSQVAGGFSTPVTAESNSSLNNRPSYDGQLRDQLEKLQRRFDEQQKAFKRVLREKDREIQEALRHQYNYYGSAAAAKATEGQQSQSVSNSGRESTGALPKANSTSVSTGGLSKSRVEEELKLLEQKQALENKHFEERRSLLQRFGCADAATRNYSSRLNANAVEFEMSYADNETAYRNSVPDGFEPELSRSQLAARQAVPKDLPTFSGNPEEWPLFFASFESTSRMCGYSDEENLIRLQRSLKGKALESVRSRLLHPSNLTGVIATLRTLFGRPEIIVHSLVSKIRDMPSPRAEKLPTLIDFGVAVQNMCATIKACGLAEHLCNVALLQELVDRLPAVIKLNWALHRQTLHSVTLSDLGDWLEKLVEAACAVTIPAVSGQHGVHRGEGRGRKGDNFLNVHTDGNIAYDMQNTPIKSKEPQQGSGKFCVACKEGCSSLERCKRFHAMDVESRWSLLKEYKLCRKCLRRHFGACSVKTPCGKSGCKFMHNKLLHDDARYSQLTVINNPASHQDFASQNCNVHLKAVEKILFRYIPVILHGRGGATVKTYAFLDDGSSATLMDHCLLKELNLEGTPNPLCLNWTAGQQRSENESVELPIRISGDQSGSKIYEMLKVHTVHKLALPFQSISMNQLSARYPHLEGVPFKSHEAISPQILIGIDNCRLGHILSSKEGEVNHPVAAKTRLGWLVYGPCGTAPKGSTSDIAHHSFHMCPCNKERENNLNNALKEYFSLDSLGISKTAKPLLSRDEERARYLLTTQTRLVGKRYETGLLWRFDNIRLPDSKGMALQRLRCLETRMHRDKKLAEILKAKVRHYEDIGYIRKLTSYEVAEKHPRAWYLPIFPVVNPNKPGKVRIVWDAAASVSGVSLNSFLLSGPDQLTSLISVLYKFREFRVAITGDIREMFHQVLVNETDQHSQRFLWRDGDTDREPEVFQMKVMTFGATCSPSIAQYVKNHNAERFRHQYPRAVEAIHKEHYVDDMLSSVETEDEAARLALDVCYIHSQGGFEIRNWLSNSRKVLDKLRVGVTDEKNMDLYSVIATEKVLGLWWCTATDKFTFRLSPKHNKEIIFSNKTPTKREVLRTLMTIYDPLGLIGNFLMYLKVLLQEIWRSGVGWDDEIPTKLDEKWKVWLCVLPSVEQVQIPRCYRQVTAIDKNYVTQLHIFVDASESGMAAVVYVRFEQNSQIECALVGSKTRVAPLRYLSIPRMELQAAVIGVRLADTIAKSHRLTISERFFWTDSRDVICWLQSEHRRYSQFVACRVSEILESSTMSEWRWISTKLNVADEGTKWQKVPDLKPTSRWFRGVEFLWMPMSVWPPSVHSGSTTEELRSNILHHTIQEPVVCVERFSKWKRLLRTVAYVKRFVSILRCKVEGMAKQTGPLTHEELIAAEWFIYSLVQRQVYPEEVRILADIKSDTQNCKRLLPKSSFLYTLCPVADDRGVLRVNGRINAIKFVGDLTKRPILLPEKNRITDLIIGDYHSKSTTFRSFVLCITVYAKCVNCAKFVERVLCLLKWENSQKPV
ncbi:uncharacterized protein LOC131433817 [Malaya genurostris]|uniref:uncharacterized protein LOC131433817 n=1 Tax=Malaya genurostris TaxID=325434 RepID=UPI0026F3FC21|nr:uncharacterized protein LOC131433817 [Malaya genurostris]